MLRLWEEKKTQKKQPRTKKANYFIKIILSISDFQ